MPLTLNRTVIYISDSSNIETNTITNTLSQDNVKAVQKSLLDLISYVEKFKNVRVYKLLS
jgi:hypothetical protein